MTGEIDRGIYSARVHMLRTCDTLAMHVHGSTERITRAAQEAAFVFYRGPALSGSRRFSVITRRLMNKTELLTYNMYMYM